MAVLADAIVLVVTWLKTADTWRRSRDDHNMRPTLTMLLLRDGVCCYACSHYSFSSQLTLLRRYILLPVSHAINYTEPYRTCTYSA